MSALAPTVQPFFTEQLLQERNASPHTSAAYRDTIRLLLRFAATRCDREPSLLDGPASMPHSRRVPRSPPDRERQRRTRNGPSGRDPLLYRYSASPSRTRPGEDIERALDPT